MVIIFPSFHRWKKIAQARQPFMSLRSIPDVFLPRPVGLFQPQSGRGLGISPSSAVSQRHWAPRSGIQGCLRRSEGLSSSALSLSALLFPCLPGRRIEGRTTSLPRSFASWRYFLAAFPALMLFLPFWVPLRLFCTRCPRISCYPLWWRNPASSGSLFLSTSSCTPFGFPYTAASLASSLRGPWPLDIFFSPGRCSSLLWWARASTRVLTCSAISSLKWRRRRLLSGLPGVARPFFRRSQPAGGLFFWVSLFPPWQLSEMPPSWLFACCIVFPEAAAWCFSSRSPGASPTGVSCGHWRYHLRVFSSPWRAVLPLGSP